MLYLTFSEEELERLAHWYIVCEIEMQDDERDLPLIEKLEKYSKKNGFDVDFRNEKNL